MDTKYYEEHDFYIDYGLSALLLSAAEAINLLKNTQDMFATSRLRTSIR